MSAFLAAANSVALDWVGDDDAVDKMSRQYSVVVLVIFCVIVSTNQYAGHPINCWVPATFTASMRDYAESLCWVKNTYYAPTDRDLPMRDDEVKQSELNYYQWVPVMLALQALLFYAPHIVWRALNSRVGCDLRNVVKLLTDATMLNQDVHDKAIRFATVHIDKFLVSRSRKAERVRRGAAALTVDTMPAGGHRNVGRSKADALAAAGRRYGEGSGWACGLQRSGSHIVTIYLLTKVLYLGNAVGQLLLLNHFLGMDYSLYGLRVLIDLVARRETADSARFPRATLCSFRVRETGGNVHRHTVQCVLPVNMFNEKIYVFLWYWLALVAVLTFFSLAKWAWAVTKMSRVALCRAYLRRAPSDTFHYSARERSLVGRFADRYLRQDGAFIVRLLSKNVNSVVVSEIVLSLYENYRRLRRKLEHRDADECGIDDDEEDDYDGGGGECGDGHANVCGSPQGISTNGKVGHV